MKVCNQILGNFHIVKAYFRTPKNLAGYAYEELVKRVEEFDINFGYEFEQLAYKRIYFSVLNNLRKGGIIDRQSREAMRETSMDPVYIDGRDIYRRIDRRIANMMGISFERSHEGTSHKIKIEELMEGLSKQQRIIFQGKVFQGLTYKEIIPDLPEPLTIYECSLKFREAKNHMMKKYQQQVSH